MSKRSNIKWRDKDLAELQRVVKNFNAKIARVEKKSPHISHFLPEKISVKGLKSKIETRADFNRELSSVRRFSEKGAENVKTLPSGATLTNYRLNEARIKSRIVEGAKTRERKKANLSVQAGNMGSIKANNLRPKQFNPNKSMSDWDKFEQVLEKAVMSNYKHDKAEKYKENYLKAIKEQLGPEGYDLYRHVETLDPHFVVEHGVSNPKVSISFSYEGDLQGNDVIAEIALEEWLELA